jgi:hypothetical protein
MVSEQGEHDETDGVSNTVRAAKVGAESGLPVCSRGHEVEPSARAENAAAETLSRGPALEFERNGRHRDEESSVRRATTASRSEA